jgi:large subunit ribosomal protein L17
MRHLKKGRKLNRDREHRNAMFNNMLESFFQYERIQTTAAKAKELRRLSEKMITRAKQNTLHNKRIVLKKLHNRDAVAKLFEEIAPKYHDVHGGYTRILKIGRRQGDGAELSLLELADVKEKPVRKEKVKEPAEPKKSVKSAAPKTTTKTKTEETKTADRELEGAKTTSVTPKAPAKKTAKQQASKTAKPKKTSKDTKAKAPAGRADQKTEEKRTTTGKKKETPKAATSKPVSKPKASATKPASKPKTKESDAKDNG